MRPSMRPGGWSRPRIGHVCGHMGPWAWKDEWSWARGLGVLTGCGHMGTGMG